ncbi:MAG TPA: FUN14 domain-containing protein [Nitrospira sp.]|nr:FUN14 domain-containing protein [Nitrospira sp.]
MSNPVHPSQSGFLAKTLGTVMSDPPWAAKSFLAAGATTVAGLGAWLSNMMSPALASGGASFLGGFLIGWAFRKTLKLALLVTGSLLVLIAVLKTTGWIHLDWTLIQADATRTLDWAQGKAQDFKEVLTGYLPSAGAAGVGALFGFRKK